MRYLLGVLLMWWAILATLWLTSRVNAADPLVSLFEQRFVMQPGQTRVVPECGCTIRYLGTSVNGRHYDVRIDRLD